MKLVIHLSRGITTLALYTAITGARTCSADCLSISFSSSFLFSIFFALLTFILYPCHSFVNTHLADVSKTKNEFSWVNVPVSTHSLHILILFTILTQTRYMFERKYRCDGEVFFLLFGEKREKKNLKERKGNMSFPPLKLFPCCLTSST